MFDWILNTPLYWSGVVDLQPIAANMLVLQTTVPT